MEKFFEVSPDQVSDTVGVTYRSDDCVSIDQTGNVSSGMLWFSAEGWDRFVARVKAGEYDLAAMREWGREFREGLKAP